MYCLNTWKVNKFFILFIAEFHLFAIIYIFFRQRLNSNFRSLKKGVREFHETFVLVPVVGI